MALITPTQVVDIAFTNKNTDKYLVKPSFIEIAELNFIQPSIGEKIYQQIVDDVDNNVSLINEPKTYALIECQASYDALHHKYFTIYTTDDAIKYAVYFRVINTDDMAVPPTYDDVIPVDLTPSSNAVAVATAIQGALDGNPHFTATSNQNIVSVLLPTGASQPSNATTTSFSFSAGGSFGTTAGSNTITCPTNSFVEVGDFVTSVDLPLRENGTDSCRPFNIVESVDTVGAVTQFRVTGDAINTNANSLIYIQKPNGKLLNDYILDYLAFCVKFEMMPDMSYNTTSQGIVENVGEFTMPVDGKKLNFLRNETFKKSESYLRKMTKFLEDNHKSFPDYCNENDGGVSKKNGIILY
jgi:hypothetical protein